MRKLFFTTGSPFARAVRIILDEKSLDYERHEVLSADALDGTAASCPTLQVPALVDGSLQLWDSLVIAEYLMDAYPSAVAPYCDEPLAEALYRPATRWNDKLLLATILTLGESVAVVSQMRWTGVTPRENTHVARNAARVLHLASWLEAQAPRTGGFFPGQLSAQDIFLTCFLAFIEKRPLEIAWRSPERPRIAALCDRLQERSSFQANPILWWEPGVIGYEGRRPVFERGRPSRDIW